jgi:exonuclease SbcC
MKILSIKGKNIASLEGEFSVDFESEPLVSAGIFAISGPTGAGKSTLLDAMCLALFCNTPRTAAATENNVKIIDASGEELSQDDTRSLLRRGTASGYAEVTFEALDKDKYRAKWSVSRAYNKIDGKLQETRMELYNISKERPEQGTKTALLARVEQLVGLKFQQFTRAVLLAQGDFATFLKAKQEEKAALLEKLTGTQIYSAISSKVFEHNKVATDEHNTLKEQMANISLMSEEELAEAKTESSKTDVELKELDAANDELKAVKQRIATLDADLKTKRSSLTKAETDMANAKKLLTEAAEKHSKAQAEEKELELQSETLTISLKEARALDLIIDSQKKETEQTRKLFTEADKKKKDNEKSLSEAEAEKQNLEKTLTETKEFFIKFEKKRKTVEQHEALKLRLERAREIKESIAKATLSIADAEKKLNKATADGEAIEKKLSADKASMKKTEDELRTTEKRKAETDTKKLDEEIAKTEELLHKKKLEIAENVLSLRESLKDGEVCPVCGSTVHPYSDHSLAASAEVVEGIQKSLNELKARKTEHEKLTATIIHLQQLISTMKDTAAETEKKAVAIKGEQTNLSTIIAKEKGEKREMESSLSKLSAEITALFGNDSWTKAWEESPKKLEQSLNGFVSQWKEKELQQADTEKKLMVSAERISTLQREKPELDNTYNKYEKSLSEQRAVLNDSLLRRKGMIGGMNADDVEKAHAEKVRTAKAAISAIAERQSSLTAETAKSEGTVQTLKGDIASLVTLTEEAQKALTTWNERFAATYGTTDIDALIKTLRDKKTTIAFRLKTHEENEKKAKKLTTELQKAFERNELWGKLNELIGSRDGSKFKQAVQVYTLEYLVEHANLQLSRLNPRYELKCVPGKLALEIVDHDMCEEIRSVHTLSGGESFLVSLALAIGLAGLSSNQMNVESLFIDEGFGSLDADTLRVAMEALENLRTEGRKIGVISHVQEMTERIPTQVRVSRNGNGRSSVEVITL